MDLAADGGRVFFLTLLIAAVQLFDMYAGYHYVDHQRVI